MQGKHCGERDGKGERAKTFDDSLLNVVSVFENFHDSRKHQTASIMSFTSGTYSFVSLPTVTVHRKSLITPILVPVRERVARVQVPFHAAYSRVGNIQSMQF